MSVELLVKEHRVFKKISQSQLAKKLKVHKQMVSNFERELCEIPLKYFKPLSEFLEIDLHLMVRTRAESEQNKVYRYFY